MQKAEIRGYPKAGTSYFVESLIEQPQSTSERQEASL